MADKYARFKTDWYTDQNGREWMCIRRNEGMSCTCTDGSFTAATFAIFSSWGWKRQVLDSSSAVERLAVNEDVAGSKPACPATTSHVEALRTALKRIRAILAADDDARHALTVGRAREIAAASLTLTSKARTTP